MTKPPPLLGAICVACLFLAIAGPATASDHVKTIQVPNGGEPAAAQIDAKGVIHLVFNSPEGPRYSNSLDNGKLLGHPIRVIQSASQTPGLEFSAWDMAIGAGKVHVVMGNNAWKLKLPKREWAMFYACLDPGAKEFTPLQNINEHPSEGFSIAADDKGNVAACWLSGKLFANLSHDYGKTFGPAVEIDSECDPCDCCTTSTAFGRDGKLAVLYREETNNQRDMYVLMWDQAHNERLRTRVSGTPWEVNACPMTYFKLVPNEEGFIAIWPTKQHVFMSRLDKQGVVQAPGEIETSATTGMRTGVLALSNANGNTLVVWKQRHELHWQLYDPTGAALETSGSAPGAGKGVAGVVDAHGDFLLFR